MTMTSAPFTRPFSARNFSRGSLLTCMACLVCCHLVVVSAPPSASAAQLDYRPQGEIRFVKGTSRKTVGASVKPKLPDCWTFRTRRGQTVRASVTSDRSAARLFLNPFEEGSEYDTTQSNIDDRGTRSYSETSEGGVQDVCVGTIDAKRTNYLLTISVTN